MTSPESPGQEGVRNEATGSDREAIRGASGFTHSSNQSVEPLAFSRPLSLGAALRRTRGEIKPRLEC
ncbi:hypothetical protein RRG08_059232 [Elysia crispata]|uniref:Uncharacterized protein n=1 Tax=Elysia crispata TaxID=231223 RepID=A0AAE0ZFP0_9GAST|nr:hypothetical protein RRG08_059232 [Elysia crispata]